MPPRYTKPARSDKERRQRRGFALWLSVFEMWALSWHEQAEHATMMYDTELAEYREANPPPQLKSYMIQTKGQPR